MDITEAAVRELKRARLPTRTSAKLDGRKITVKLRMGQVGDTKMPHPWTNFQQHAFTRWWERTGRHLGLSKSKYDLAVLFNAGFRGFDTDGRPLFRRHDVKSDSG